MLAVVKREYSPLLDEIVVEGVRVLVARYHRENGVPAARPDATEVRRHVRALSGIQRATREIVRTVEVGSKVVELFDTMMVNGKPLGDTTRDDLRAEADRISKVANRQLATANTLTRIANELAGNETVRKAYARNQIIAILEQAFKA